MTAMTELSALDRYFDAMPPAAAMRIRAERFDGDLLALHAPLTANLNDKGCAFGGSLASVMTLAGWGLLTLKLKRAGLDAEVYVADSQVRYLAPLYDDLRAEATLSDGGDWDAALHCFRSRGRARLALGALVRSADGRLVASLQARFAIMPQTNGGQ
ncbi:MAG TPA: YiiD C-terminal domain-containing protein [Arenimonas sp.]|uniref:YiiD C-terminal domain-containing protein n=1 Tax=Arenimonas sp. TaxID=1872635 RepID=UPI002CC6802B|nr:YiiD C-terminal domain-containing protein [Arenimonas sp.]HMB57137.1 YiiD C-terminal domain-containing protein [Arenimonas sp.]